MKIKKYRYFSADFETTVYNGQDHTEVWASAVVELFTEDVKLFHSIGETFDYFRSLKGNLCIYYHNLKFDGSFWIDYLLSHKGMEQAVVEDSKNVNNTYFLEDKDMKNNTFSYVISAMGQWYCIRIKIDNRYIEIRDSLKLLPFSVKAIGSGFNTKHRKLDMEYEGFRYAGCEITPEEAEYIANDVLVVKEALEFMFDNKHNKLTIGSCCLSEYRRLVGNEDYKYLFPDVEELTIAPHFGSKNVDEYIRHSYRGGWCYVARGKENKIYHKGVTADVNSLYPSMMSSESGNRYPVGKPTFWSGNYIPDEARADNKYYFVRIKTRFYIKPDKLPFIQVKKTLMYKVTEMLESSDILNPADGKYYSEYIDLDGNRHDTRVEMTLTMTDYQLIKEHYDLVDFEILDGCYFDSQIGIFDIYIEKYKKIKQESKGAMRQLAKLFLNNLYGKMSSSTDSSFKVAYLKPDKTVGFYTVFANEKKAGYIPVGSAITSYARNFTIRTAQQNYYGKDKRGFIYADTDSIHCDLEPSELKGLTIHPKNFCCWDLESCWDEAIFVRQKTYIEHVIQEELEDVTPYWNVKCAGMPSRCKDLFVWSMTGDIPEDEKLRDEEIEFLDTKRTIEDFKVGLKVPSKLLPKRIRGGILLVNSSYEMR